ncbi:zinc-binding dehydrogenase [Streptomyces capparidis]
MHAIRLHAFGPAENLRHEKVDDPEPGPGQVRIAVAAAGVHLLDCTLRQGVEGGPFPLPELPSIPGREVAGTVDAVGPGTDPSWLGRRVAARTGLAGGYAELALADAAGLHPLPEGLAEDAAVAMIGTGRTTMGILDTARLAPGDVVVVTGAAGGVGSLLVQAARNAGAFVVGLAGGPEKTERVRALGADAAVDYSAPDWTDRAREALDGREVTLGLDGVGGALGRGALELTAPGGRFVLFGWSSGAVTEISAEDLYSLGVTVSAAIGPALLKRYGGMAGLRPLEERALAAAASGDLVPLVDRFPLAEAARAHAALEGRRTTGKVVLVP